jgi:hypothetical protein
LRPHLAMGLPFSLINLYFSLSVKHFSEISNRAIGMKGIEKKRFKIGAFLMAILLPGLF